MSRCPRCGSHRCCGGELSDELLQAKLRANDYRRVAQDAIVYLSEWGTPTQKEHGLEKVIQELLDRLVDIGVAGV